MAETEVRGHTYRIGRLNAFDQIHIARRLGPLISSFFDVIGTLPKIVADDEEESFKIDIVDILNSNKLDHLTKALAELPDEQVDQIISKCLEVCSRAVTNSTGAVTAFTPIWNKQAKQLQYQDITTLDMLTLTKAVLQEHLSDFFPTTR
jgi:hypothetical protein